MDDLMANLSSPADDHLTEMRYYGERGQLADKCMLCHAGRQLRKGYGGGANLC